MALGFKKNSTTYYNYKWIQGFNETSKLQNRLFYLQQIGDQLDLHFVVTDFFL